jgi:hypothetical protein
LVPRKAGAQQKQTYPSLAGSRTEQDFQRLGHSKISTEKPGPGREEKSPARWQMNSRKHLAATQQLGRQEKLKTEVKNAGGAEKSTAGPGVAL